MANTASSALEATAAGVGAVTLAVIGVEPQALLWGAIGALIGMTLAAPAGRVRAALTLIAVALACAELGTWAAVRYFDAAPIARNGACLVLGILFHPLLAILVGKLPAIVSVVTRTPEKP